MQIEWNEKEEQGDGSCHDGGNGGDAQDLSVDILHDGLRFGPHIRCQHLVGLKGKEVGKGCHTRDDVLVRDAGFLLSGKRVPFVSISVFFVFQ